MRKADFRRIALDLPESVESEHMNHPDFRVRGKIFATLSPDGKHGVVMLTPDQQQTFVDTEPNVFAPANGAWGRRGCTEILLSAATASIVRNAINLAWQNKAPKRLASQTAKENG